MVDNLARFERMAQRTKMRAAVAREQQLTPAEQWVKDRADVYEQGRQRRQQLVKDGPPNGCHACWRLEESFPWTGAWWDWHHAGPINPVTRIADGWEDDSEPVEHCTHECHGPGGYPILVVAYG